MPIRSFFIKRKNVFEDTYVGTQNTNISEYNCNPSYKTTVFVYTRIQTDQFLKIICNIKFKC